MCINFKGCGWDLNHAYLAVTAYSLQRREACACDLWGTQGQTCQCKSQRNLTNLNCLLYAIYMY